MKPNTRIWIGVALLGAGAVVAGTAVLAGVRKEAEGEAQREAATRAADEAAKRQAAERALMEKKVRHAATLKPLNAAVRDRVDGPTLIDLFDDEDWWQPYRDEVAGAQVTVGNRV